VDRPLPCTYHRREEAQPGSANQIAPDTTIFTAPALDLAAPVSTGRSAAVRCDMNSICVSGMVVARQSALVIDLAQNRRNMTEIFGDLAKTEIYSTA
jgi:hypothetical protein